MPICRTYAKVSMTDLNFTPADAVNSCEGNAGCFWHLYLIECRNGAFYAGITNNLEARYQAHSKGRGAKFTRANPPVRLLGSTQFPDRSTASRAEWAIKQLPRAKKLAFLKAHI